MQRVEEEEEKGEWTGRPGGGHLELIHSLESHVHKG